MNLPLIIEYLFLLMWNLRYIYAVFIFHFIYNKTIHSRLTKTPRIFIGGEAEQSCDQVTCDMLQVTGDMWKVIGETLQVTSDT